MMISATDCAVRGELIAPVLVTRRKIGPVVTWAVSSQARSARTGQGRGGSAYTTSSSWPAPRWSVFERAIRIRTPVGGGGEVLDLECDEL